MHRRSVRKGKPCAAAGLGDDGMGAGRRGTGALRDSTVPGSRHPRFRVDRLGRHLLRLGEIHLALSTNRAAGSMRPGSSRTTRQSSSTCSSSKTKPHTTRTAAPRRSDGSNPFTPPNSPPGRWSSPTTNWSPRTSDPTHAGRRRGGRVMRPGAPTRRPATSCASSSAIGAPVTAAAAATPPASVPTSPWAVRVLAPARNNPRIGVFGPGRPSIDLARGGGDAVRGASGAPHVALLRDRRRRRLEGDRRRDARDVPVREGHQPVAQFLDSRLITSGPAPARWTPPRRRGERCRPPSAADWSDPAGTAADCRGRPGSRS